MAEAAREWNADIKDIGEKIVNLSLLQAKELSDYLKDEHGLEAAALPCQMIIRRKNFGEKGL